MKTVGIIAEFNPFHNGHKYLIDKARKITGADYVVIVCSGNYVQRGMPAVFDKSIRVKSAVANGADAVFELPVVYSTASAELFARAAVRFLDRLNCIDYLCFGCEADNLKGLPVIASILSNEPELYKKYLSDAIKTGLSFPKARMSALKQYCNENNILDEYQLNLLLSQPNNILAIEYLKAIKHLNSSIRPVAVKRIGASYDSCETDTEFASATGIRNAIAHGQSFRHLVPDNCYESMKAALPLDMEDFALLLGYKLYETENYNEFADISEDLSNRIRRHRNDFINADGFITEIQSKNFTYAAISRTLLHILLDIRQEDIRNFIEKDYFTYARLLGFRQDSRILSYIKEKSTLPVISRLSSYYRECSKDDRKMLDICIHADDIYRMVYMNKYKNFLPTELERQMIISS